MWYNVPCMSTRTRSLVLLSGLAGLGISGASVWVHHQLLTDPSYTSFCDINATFSCAQVYLSQYGSFQGVSTALGGLLWFGVAVLIAAFSRVTPAAAGAGTKAKAQAVPLSPAGAYLFAWSTIGFAVVLYLAYASFFVLKTGCLLCIGTYICVIAIFLLSGTASSVSVGDLPGRLGDDLKGIMGNPKTLTVAVLFLAAAGTSLAFFPTDTRPRTAAEAEAQVNQAAPPPADAREAWLKEWEAAPRIETGEPADGAKVVILKFNDFQCPACRDGFVWYKPVLDKYAQSHPGAVKFAIKDFPLEGECNFAVPQGNHYAACESAGALRLARQVGKADAMEQWLFDNQARLTAEVVQQGFQTVTGLSTFTAQYPTVLAGIRQDVSDGVALRIDSTPTYFLNGVRLKGNMQAQYFDLAIEYEIKKAEGK